MGTLQDYFTTDFPHYVNIGWELKIAKKNANGIITVPTRVYFCYDAAVRFIAVYIPGDSFSQALCRAVMEQWPTVLQFVDRSVEVQSRLTTAESSTYLKGLPFSGRLYFYVAATVSAEEREHIESLGKERQVAAIIRDETWAAERSRFEKPLAFISHDSRDKDSIARPIAEGLSRRMCPVWFDEYSLKIGDSLRESIEKGLKECQRCILILTPNFLSNSGWTRVEVNSIFTRELIEERRVILPVWADVQKKEVYEYSPSLAGRVAARWDRGVDQIVRDLLAVISVSAA